MGLCTGLEKYIYIFNFEDQNFSHVSGILQAFETEKSILKAGVAYYVGVERLEAKSSRQHTAWAELKGRRAGNLHTGP